MKKFNVTLIALLITVVFVLSTVFAACTPGEPSDSNKLPDKDVCNHSLTRVAAVKETCTTAGNLQYWFCSKCGKYFADGNAANEIDKNDATIAAHHTLTHEQWEHDENGHWKVCGACGQQIDYHAHNFEDYVCTDCGAVDEANRPLTEKEIVEKIYPLIKDNLQNAIGLKSTLLDILAVDYYDTTLNLLVKNHKIVYEGVEADYLDFVTFTMKATLTKENFNNGSYIVSSKTSGRTLVAIPLDSQDPRGVEILKKIDPDGDHDHYDFVSVSKDGGGGIIPSLGQAMEIKIYTLNELGITTTILFAQSSSAIKDSIENSILNGEEGKNYKIASVEELKFNNVIYNFNGLL